MKGPLDHANPTDSDVGWLNKTGMLLRLKAPCYSHHIREAATSDPRAEDYQWIYSEDALELKLTWQEAQDLLRPPLAFKPNVVLIEDYEFEEYDEPLIFGKRTIFTARASGDQDQWIRCDECFK